MIFNSIKALFFEKKTGLLFDLLYLNSIQFL